jgi:hypothetical protein
MQSGIEGEMVTSDGIEDRKELSHASGERQLWSLALLEQMRIEAADSRIVSGGDKCSHVQGASHRGASAPSGLTATELPGVAIQRNDADQGTDFRWNHNWIGFTSGCVSNSCGESLTCPRHTKSTSQIPMRSSQCKLESCDCVRRSGEVDRGAHNSNLHVCVAMWIAGRSNTLYTLYKPYSVLKIR